MVVTAHNAFDLYWIHVLHWNTYVNVVTVSNRDHHILNIHSDLFLSVLRLFLQYDKVFKYGILSKAVVGWYFHHLIIRSIIHCGHKVNLRPRSLFEPNQSFLVWNSESRFEPIPVWERYNVIYALLKLSTLFTNSVLHNENRCISIYQYLNVMN